MFRGVNPINLDAKGRMAIPARYRQQIQAGCEGCLVATIDTEERCLLLYPLPEWEQIQQKIEALPSFNPAARRIQRLLIGHATDLEMDGSGRLLLTAPLREYAGLDKKVILLGQGRKFEIWSEDLWNQTREQYLKDVEGGMALPDELQTLSL
ncbi:MULTISPECIES: division/cell wall cluster transcriptional repressor MraZ [Marinobacterium]|jgi:MraZ protein|uniref:Transcriptional regulator MraZ n=1 Tax=Marinobacterium aestuarii TaxID=1821621 RepID=A0A1A9EVN3_9GAMM|nr:MULTISPECIES: division/cell wall cluster transcriptional repressor MraZ [Marinobacterium]ANG61945.1 cell division/cell wall cluster transcriptional repressor MraZ [Marinobacterium aestuarii]MCP8689586.1 division/cell wall cluster transcriptional repressor MraZ [Marinobacterium sedimentorum]